MSFARPGKPMASMERIKQLSLVGFLITTSTGALTTERSFIFDRPIQSSIAAFIVAGAVLLLLDKYFPRLWEWDSREPAYSALPLSGRYQPHPSRDPSPNPAAVRQEQGEVRWWKVLFLITVLLLSVRIELLRRVLKNVECSRSGIEYSLPIVLCLYEAWGYERSGRYSDLPVDLSVYAALFQKLSGSRMRFLLPSILSSWGGVLLSLGRAEPRSTYICPLVLPDGQVILGLQVAGVIIDFLILVILTKLLKRDDTDHSWKSPSAPKVIAWILIASAFSLGVAGLVVFYTQEENRTWIMALDKLYLQDISKHAVFFAVFIPLALHMVQKIDLLGTLLLFQLVVIFTAGLASSWAEQHPFVPLAKSTNIFAVLFIFLGTSSYFYVQASWEGSQPASPSKRISARTPSWLYSILGFIVITMILLDASHTNTVGYHAIDLLTYDAHAQHQEWMKQASQSTNLEEAVEEYRRRYNRHPPPRFDEWYKYATTRSSVVIDDYDAINRDLLPFWSLSPEELRIRTKETVSDSWTEISGIMIRNGTAMIDENALPTHRWMLEGVAVMIGKFSKWLPDMDLAFNLNDESRVAVPWDQVEKMRTIGSAADTSSIKNKWSDDPRAIWDATHIEPDKPQKFIPGSFQNTYYDFGSVGCPPNSKARTERVWDVSRICLDCLYPHALGQFVRNWTLAADICHQPDLANLHGFYESPAAFKTAYDLMPVFSQSKVHGFNDILYPSAWNYIDKVRYAPSEEHPDLSYAQKSNTLFWRGATSEGVSFAGTWKGMARQRAIHLANNDTTARYVLLPSGTKDGKYRYWKMPPEELSRSLNIDMGVVDKIDRCGLEDCPDQKEEFGLVGPSDFQHHWSFRYLFDLDGAAFSGRFLPFLQSRSLPFKTALFREWYSDRLTPWLHFVPIDLRLQDVFSTLAYFGGMEGKAGGKHVSISAHEAEGQRIAEAGRDWVERVIRKEDMEIYFFRLLLEWARLVDDERDRIGFQVHN